MCILQTRDACNFKNTFGLTIPNLFPNLNFSLQNTFSFPPAAFNDIMKNKLNDKAS